MPKGDYQKTKDAIVQLRGVVRDGELVSLLDHDSNEIGAPVTATKGVTGGIGIQWPDGKVTRRSPGGRGVGYDPVGVPIVAGSGTIVSQTSVAYTATEVDTPDGRGLRLVSSTPDKYIEMSFALPTPMAVRNIAVIAQAMGTTQATLGVYAGTDSAFTQNINKGINVATGSGKNGSQANGLMMPFIVGAGPSNAWANASSLNLDTTLFTHVKVRITPAAGQVADLTIFGLRINPNRKSRIVITADDGKSSWFKYALPLLQARGLVSSNAVIPSLVGSSSSYMTLDQIKALAANGHEILAHGPVGGAGSLIANYATTADRMADVTGTLAWMEQNRLIERPQQRACYIYPQGAFQDSSGDTALLDAMQAAGITTGRTVTRFLPYSHDAARATKYGGLITPIIGHQRQTTQVAEDTEITNITTAISYCADNGLDGILMFHDVIADQGTFSATTAIEIEVSRLKTILDAVVAQVAAGKAENVLFSDLV